MKHLMCDPPEGWKYGFPRRVPMVWHDEKDIRPWILACGYPPEVMKSYGDHFNIRFWEVEEEDETS